MIKRVILGSVVALMLSSAFCLAGTKTFFFKNNDSVVFLGDSITEQRLYTTYLEAYTLTRFPHAKFTFRNVGWGGDTAWLRQRFHTDEGALFAAKGDEQQALVEKAVGAGLTRDVLPLKPTAVTVDFGMNDHAYQAFRPDIFAAYTRSQAQIVKVLAAKGARVALVTPQPIEEHRTDPDKDVRNQSLSMFSDGLKGVATNSGALFVDQFNPFMAIMMQARAQTPGAFVGGGDAVHPGPAGQTLMAWAILKGLGAPAEVSVANLDVMRFLRSKVVCARNCKVTNVKCASGILTFDRIDAALPMPIDPRAEAALALAPIANDLNRYELKILGLKADRYAVTLDGQPLTEVSGQDLAKGWNMATVSGPITKQSQHVLDLVFQKNNVFFNRWRNIQLRSGDPALLAQQDKQIADLESQIDVARQPVLHHFELKPLSK